MKQHGEKRLEYAYENAGVTRRREVKMVTDAEAVEIMEMRLNKLGMCFKDKKSVEADIKAIRERKITGTKNITEKWRKQ